MSSPVKSPLDIVIEFEAQDGATIVPTSFRAKWGWLDLTSRIRRHATIDHKGVHARNAELPSGEFNLDLEIADSLNRTGRMQLRIAVQ